VISMLEKENKEEREEKAAEFKKREVSGCLI
jgi:hypothetical protein